MRSPVQPKLSVNAGRLPQVAATFLAGWQRFGARACPRQKSPAPREEREAWGRRLDEEKESLFAMVRATEAEFLATGDGLQRIAQQMNEIQRDCQSLTELTLGQTPDAAVPFAFQLLKKAEDLVLASDEQYDHVFATFGELQQRLAQLAVQHAELIKVLLPLNFITISFRIEASRHPVEVQQAFFTLADKVTRIVSEVRATMEGQFTELATSERIARHLMDQVSASIQRHRCEVNATLKTSRTHLCLLSEALNGSGTIAADLSLRNRAVTRHISGIVLAQQCQDITRQRIDHVGEALEEMRSHLHGTRASPAAPDSDPRAFVFRAAQIQLHQIQSVFNELNHAAAALKSGMQNLRDDAGAAAEAAVNVGRTALDTDVAHQCQAGIGQILAIVRHAVDATGDVLAAFAPLQAGFLDCTSKATALAGDVRHSGLNAQVFAIHAADGATLDVLAGHVRLISDEAIHQVGQMGAALNHTTEIVNNLRARLEDFQNLGRADHEVLANESTLSRKKLSELENAIPLLISRVTEQQRAFAAAIERVLAKVHFPVTVAAASSRSIGVFQELVAWGGTGCGGLDGVKATAEEIERLQSTYTMDSERIAHAAALRPIARAVGETAPGVETASLEDETAGLSSISSDDRAAASAPGIPAPDWAKSNASTELGDNVDLC